MLFFRNIAAGNNSWLMVDVHLRPILNGWEVQSDTETAVFSTREAAILYASMLEGTLHIHTDNGGVRHIAASADA